MSTLERAIEIATGAHRGQRDKAGHDYIGHPLRVMAAGKTPEEKIAGVLHDVVEDSDWTLEQLAAEGFAPEIIEALPAGLQAADGRADLLGLRLPSGVSERLYALDRGG